MFAFLPAALLSFIFSPSSSAPLPNEKLGCFADLSSRSNRKTDVVLFEGTTVTALKQTKVDGSSKDFGIHHRFDVGGRVQSVSAFDVNTDGIADLFIVTENASVPGGHTLTVWVDSGAMSFQSTPEVLHPIHLADEHVLVLDADGDFIPDVFGRDRNTNAVGFWFGAASFSGNSFKALAIDDIELSTASFIDLDQDCRAELVYMTTDHKIKMVVGAANWRSFDHGHHPDIVTLVDLSALHIDDAQKRLFFADVNKDGAMDIIVPTNGLEVHLFVQRRNFGFKALCTARKDLSDFDKSFERITMRLTGEDIANYKLSENLPFIVQDVDLDLNIDIVAVLKQDGSNEDGKRVFVGTLSVVEQNHAVKQNSMTTDIADRISGAGGVETGGAINDLALFHSGEFPFGLHFMIKTQSEWKWVDLEPLLEATNHGFLSVCPLNDVDPAEKRYGGAMPGATIKAFFRSRSGAEIFLTAGTFYQSNSGNHLLPFTVFGLGNPDSYIEKLVIAYSFYDHGDDFVLRQPGVPPNSQLVLFAYPRGNSARWRLETFLAPYIDAVTLALIITVAMIVLGSFWVYLEIKGRRAESSDKLKAGANTTNNFFF